MKFFLFDLLIVLSHITFFVTIFLMLFSVYKFIKRKKRNRLLYLNSLILFPSWLLFVLFQIIFVMSFFVRGTVYIGALETLTELFVIIFINFSSWLAIITTWAWIQREFKIYEDKLIYHSFWGRKELIFFSQIDLNDSKYSFVTSRKKRYLCDEVLYLTLKNG